MLPTKFRFIWPSDFRGEDFFENNQAGYRSLLLGSRVLRTETASLAVIANMQLLWGN
jgi:16S rRNA U1498 N3-methylase RsmE